MSAGQVFGAAGSIIGVAFTAWKLFQHPAGRWFMLRMALAALMLVGSGAVAYYVVVREDAPVGLIAGLICASAAWLGCDWLLRLMARDTPTDRPLDERLVPFIVAVCGFVYFVSRL